MSRNALLRQQREKDEAIKEAMQKYKDPSGLKYDLYDEKGQRIGYLEYNPKNDTATIAEKQMMLINGGTLKSLRDAIDKLLDD